MADDRSYEIFKKCSDNTTVSVETVKGIDEGKSVLAALRTRSNDEYFLFDPITGNVIDPEQPSTAIDPLAS